MAEAAPHFRCPLCQGVVSELAFHFEPGDYRRCSACGLLSLYPMPTTSALFALYDEAYYGSSEPESGDRPSEVRLSSSSDALPAPGASAGEEPGGYASYAEQRTARSRTFRRYASAMASQRPGARVLDVGCALGFFLDVALELGLDAHGIDASEAAIASIESRFGSRVRAGTLASLPHDQSATYDFVFASDLIEHVPEPHEFVAQVAELLKPGGMFFGITPNTKSLLAKLSGPRWVSLKAPEHVVLYSPKQIRALLSSRFEAIRVTTAWQEYPASLVVKRLGDLLGPARGVAQGAGRALGTRSLRVPDGNMLVVATKT